MAKILFVSNVFDNLYLFRRGLMRTLAEKGHEITAAAGYDRFKVLLAREGVPCISLRHIRRGSMNPMIDIRFLAELVSLYRSMKPDIVLHYTIKPNIFGSLAATLAGVKSISTLTGGGYAFSRNGLINHLTRTLYRVGLLFPQVVFFQNRNDQKSFEDAKLVTLRRSMLVPGSGVDLAYYAPNSYNQEDMRDKKEFVFLLIGRLLWDKGIGEFVEAAKLVQENHPRVKFWVLGRVDPENPASVPEGRIRAWEKEGLLKWLGEVWDVRPYIARADVVVLPSYYREGIPRSLLEAMAMARPIITTDAVGCREVVEDGKNGFMVPVKDAQALAEAMVKMIEIGEDSRREMGRHGRLKAEREFDERIVIQKYVEEIERLLAEKPRP